MRADLRDNDSITSTCSTANELKLQLNFEYLKNERQKKSANGFGLSQIIFTQDSSFALSKRLFTSRSYTTGGSKSSCMLSKRMTTVFRVPITEVTPQLFFGTVDDANDDELLKTLGITHIISLIGPKHVVEGIKLKQNPMNDYGRSDLEKVIKNLWTFITESQKPSNKLFVHCQSGQNRSATVILAILMKLESGPNKLKDAFSMVKKKRPVVQIHEKYAKQLSEMEKELFGVTSMPENWMKISSYCMDTGQVKFYGEGSIQKLSTQFIQESLPEDTLPDHPPKGHYTGHSHSSTISEQCELPHVGLPRAKSSSSFVSERSASFKVNEWNDASYRRPVASDYSQSYTNRSEISCKEEPSIQVQSTPSTFLSSCSRHSPKIEQTPDSYAKSERTSVIELSQVSVSDTEFIA